MAKTKQRPDKQTPPQATAEPLAIPAPWLLVGISRSAFYALMSQDKAPHPLPLPGKRRVWRRADVEKWVASMKPEKPSSDDAPSRRKTA